MTTGDAMKTAADFLDDLRAKHRLTSDYQVAKLLGMERQQVARYRKARSTFDDTTAARIAEFLEIDAAYVAACMNAQRAQTEKARAMWEKAAKVLGSTAAAVLVFACALALAPDSLTAGAAAFVVNDVYYVKSTGLLFAFIVTAYLLLTAPHSNKKKQG
jgi:transcriptional regulator with XRE-family HTH domain